MKKLTTLILLLLCAATLFAQAPEKFSYQAVVRNASNALVANAPVGIRVSILQGGVNGTLVYMETQTVVANANGLITLQIGSGNVQQGSFADIDWASGTYFLKTETDPAGGSNYSITTAQQLLSVPYALYSKEAGNGFSGDYNDLTNTPEIPTVPTNVSAFTNDAGYLTGYTETDPQFNAWDKDYNDLINTPTIPTVPTNVSAFTNDAGYLTSYTEADPQFNAWDKDYNDLINTPTIPTVPTNVSSFTNDANYVTTSQLNAANYITAAQVPVQVNADWSATTGVAQILNKPTLFSGNYNDLTNKPTLFSGNYNDLTNKPTIPTVPTVVSAFTNDAGYITAAQVPAQVNADWNATSGVAQILHKPTLFSGNYNDLTNKPTIPTVPTNVSAFTNDAGYLTSYAETDPQFNAWDKNYNDLTNKPTIPTIPANVSAFTNDAGYLTSFTETDPQFNAWDKNYNDLTNKPTLFSGNYNDLTNKPTLFSGNYNDLNNKPNLATVATTGNYNDLTNKPTIPTVPSNVSAFTNDAGYLTSADVQQAAGVPTVVSAFQNDAGYITANQVPAQVNADWNATTGAAMILNKPTIPTVPTNVSAFYNDKGYITSANIPTKVSAFTNDAGYITSANVPTVPVNLSAFNNDMGYITSAQVPAQVNADWNATSGKAQILNKPTLFSGNYNDLTNKPNIPTVPTNVSSFNNDAGYITSSQIPAQVNADWNATSGAAKILNKPAIPTVPSIVSAFSNDAHYITEAQLNALLAAMNNTIDSLRDRIEELENGETPINPNPVIPDTTTPVVPIIVDGQGCPGKEMIYDYDGNPYPTVVIGQQCWMKTNLRTTHYSDGTDISYSNSTSGTTPRRYTPYYYSGNINTYGYVYNWYAVMNGNVSSNSNPSQVQGICPVGWHVPSNSEWSQLANYVNTFSGFQCGSTDYYIAKALSSTSGWLSSSSMSCAVGYTPSLNNATGFSALPAGNQYNDIQAGTYAYFWSCTQSNSSSAYGITLQYNSPTVGVSADCYMYNFRSVRCVCDSAIIGGGSQAVVTGFVNSVTSTTAQCSGSVVTDNGYAVTERGVCWSTSHNPTIYHNRTVDGAGMGSFISSLTGLTPGTVYYVRAYARTNAGVIYGGEVQFTTPTLCGTSTVKDYDQNVYHTVQIGDQCWMKENLRSTHYADGTTIGSGNNNSGSTTTAYYYTLSGPIEYGYLYNWKAVMRNSSSSMANPSGIQGVCPTGWHVPSDAEWAALESFLSSQDSYLCSNNTAYIAKALASNSGWTTNTNTCVVGNGQSNNNVTGFSALPAGYHYSSSSYSKFGTSAIFWSSTQASTGFAWCRELLNNSAIVNRIDYNTTYGHSVRCLRN